MTTAAIHNFHRRAEDVAIEFDRRRERQAEVKT